MNIAIAAEPGSELFRGLGEASGWDIAFGPVAGRQVCWSLFRLREGRPVERIVLGAPRPSRRHLRQWLAETAGDSVATALLQLIGRVQYFYSAYYAARPDLDSQRLTAVA